MLTIFVNTILPIFSIILVGYLLKIKETIDPAFSKTANQIAFNVALPAMLLNEIAHAPIHENFDLGSLICSVVAMGIVALISLAMCRAMNVPRSRQGTFVQSSFHGNMGYMAYAIAYYALGESHFARMAILSSFLMVWQNVLGVWALTAFNGEVNQEGQFWKLVKNIVQNPVIVSVAAGIIYSSLGFTIPGPVRKGLDILSGMAFPLALLLIGASLSFGAFRMMAKEIIGIGFLKLFGLPLLGYALMAAAHVPGGTILPAMILLASPPATITYVMATELGGDPDLAATSVSVFTLASAVSYSLILSAF